MSEASITDRYSQEAIEDTRRLMAEQIADLSGENFNLRGELSRLRKMGLALLDEWLAHEHMDCATAESQKKLDAEHQLRKAEWEGQ